MPDAALDATERQFRALLAAAADDIVVRLTLYTLPEVPRTEFGRRQVRRYSTSRLWNAAITTVSSSPAPNRGRRISRTSRTGEA
jgi:hypothetical protein